MCPHALFLQAQSHNYDNLVTVSIVVKLMLTTLYHIISLHQICKKHNASLLGGYFKPQSLFP